VPTNITNFKELLIRVDERVGFMAKTIEEQRYADKEFRNEMRREIKDIKKDIGVLQKFKHSLTAYVIAFGTAFGLVFKYIPPVLAGIFR
jgi:glucosamine 6-phosphate synthetase-like amidotransferase/phosphosugar isomerase protein